MNAVLQVIDLFAGAGGFSTGLARSGTFQTVAAVEHDPDAAATFAANHPDAEVYAGDIETWMRSDIPNADVVIGGPPCQGFSNLGSRRVRDPRNALWRRYAETLALVRPAYFVMENVADFLTSGQYRDLRRETHRSGRLSNYRIEAAVLNAAEYGAPQLRRRAVIIGSSRDLPAPGHPASTHNRERWRTVRDAIGDLTEDVDGIDLPRVSTNYNGRQVRGPFPGSDLHVGRRPTQLSLDRYAAIPPGGNRSHLPDHLLAPCWRGHTTGSGDVMGRLHWDRPSVTIRTEFWKPEKGRYLHPVADRAITHLEAARLQGFDDSYQWHGSKTAIGRQIGNAVPSALAEAIGSHIHDHYQRHASGVIHDRARIPAATALR
ncbi:DNA cytosine methyltransferase [Nocardioides aromaticivorans]|uniref:DNA cytosine methyltransferase n=1 Tax=Nocardioides aromaticivorans TaxID=200618 RepID=UPI001A901F34|nr:DNA cytosine methyltransferase [Nocardioides aromaticivorans]